MGSDSHATGSRAAKVDDFDYRRIQEAHDAMCDAARILARYAPGDDYEFEAAVSDARAAYEEKLEDA